MDRIEEIRARCERVLSRAYSEDVTEREKRIDRDALASSVPFLLSEFARLTAERDEWQRRAEAAETDITNLAEGSYSICDMCALCGWSEETTPCPYKAWQNELSGAYKDTYPDEPCDAFKYKSAPCADNTKGGPADE